ncbi:MAG: DEAD/DEAH box helicase, partial [Acidobacteriota bacterium]
MSYRPDKAQGPLPALIDPRVSDDLTLHIAYRDRKLFVWGQCAPRSVPPRSLPFGAAATQVGRAIALVAEKLPVTYSRSLIWLPARGGEAIGRAESSQPDEKLRPWLLYTAMLNAESAFYFLDACNCQPAAGIPGIKLGPGARFWGAALRFVANLAGRDRFLPSMAVEDESFHARWKPLLAAPDRHALMELAQAMPPVARAITPESSGHKEAPEDDPSLLLGGFVEWLIDVFPRLANRSARPRPLPHEITPLNIASVWMTRLCSSESMIPGDGELLTTFLDQVKAWQRGALRDAAFPWLLHFCLEEPPEIAGEASEANAWRVRYMLLPAGGGAPVAIDRTQLDPASSRQLSRLLGRAATLCAGVREDADSFPLDVTGAFRFLTDTKAALEKQGFRVAAPEWWKNHEQAALVRARPVLKPSRAGGATTFSLDELMRFDWEVAIGGENYTRDELDRLAEATAPLVRVHGKWLPFEPGSIRSALELWKKEPAPAREVIRMAFGGADAPPGIEFEEARGEGWLGDLLEKLQGKARFAELPAPAGFRGSLRPYQVRGFSWLCFLREYGLGACLADDMGLGKTVQALALLGHDRARGVTRPALLVCPTSVVGNWRKEAARFAPDLPVLVHHGLSRTRGPEFIEEAGRRALVISSYSLVHRDIEVLKDVAWSGIILDEAQNIKNAETRQSQAARSLTADYRVALTGTPVENNVGELWAIMDFLNPGFLGSAADFRRRFLLPIQKRSDSAAAAELRKLTAPFILRRLKSDKSVIQDLPRKMEMKVFCNLTPEQASLYRGVVAETTGVLDSTTGIQRKGLILAALTKLKQVCNHPAQFLGDDSPLPGRSGKLSRLTEMVEELLSEGDRALIFSQFTGMGERVARHLSAVFGQEALFLHGGVPAHKRDQMVERFQNGGEEGPKLFVLSLKAGGTGLNLTAANHVFHFDRWWNPAVENQATDRAYRIGQKRNVQIHKFVCVGTLEERIDEMIERKTTIADNVVGTG